MKKEPVKIPWTLFASEFFGTALLVLVGVSFVILDFGNNSPVVRFIHDAGLRRAITGFLFGCTGALIAISWIGKESGAHINPVVTLAFWLKKKMGNAHAAGYVACQVLGGIAGALPLLFWGQMGSSITYGATLPGQDYSIWMALLGETITTFALIFMLFIFLGHKKLKQFTPFLFPILYLIMVFLEAPISGTSTNPARTIGPEVISLNWTAWWIYWVGPVTGTVLGVFVHKLSIFKEFRIEVAKLYHFEHDRHGVFKRGRR
jgi:aquaporin Z